MEGRDPWFRCLAHAREPAIPPAGVWRAYRETQTACIPRDILSVSQLRLYDGTDLQPRNRLEEGLVASPCSFDVSSRPRN